MKKTYMSPATLIVAIVTTNMVCGSLGRGSVPVVEPDEEMVSVNNVSADSRSSSYNVWDDELEEEEF